MKEHFTKEEIEFLKNNPNWIYEYFRKRKLKERNKKINKLLDINYITKIKNKIK
jgi:hypothetical protein